MTMIHRRQNMLRHQLFQVKKINHHPTHRVRLARNLDLEHIVVPMKIAAAPWVSRQQVASTEWKIHPDAHRPAALSRRQRKPQPPYTDTGIHRSRPMPPWDKPPTASRRHTMPCGASLLVRGSQWRSPSHGLDRHTRLRP
jgi:hypothetical protein